MNRATQEQRILNLLQNYAPNWVPLPEILRLGIAQYNARIKAIRDAGHTVENKIEYHGKERHSYFRLVVKPQGELF